MTADAARPLGAMLTAARAAGYAIPALNVVDVATMDGVLRAAVEARSPVIVQTAAVTARTWGPATLAAAFRTLRAKLGATAVLQLDHCDHLTLIDACLDAGWDAVLFDGAALDAADNVRQTRTVVQLAHAVGAAVEGELESIGGFEPDASARQAPAATFEDNLRFIESTGIDCFALSIGNVHGRSAAPIDLDVDLARRIADATAVALALHGGTGIPDLTMRELIAAGCVKVNVSTAIREACAAALRDGAGPGTGRVDPLTSLTAMRDAATTVALEVMQQLGSAGRVRQGG
jgi:fructose-bisphosphate aldolase class II